MIGMKNIRVDLLNRSSGCYLILNTPYMPIIISSSKFTRQDKTSILSDIIMTITFRVFDEFVSCKIVIMPGGKFDYKPYAIGYQKDSPYNEILDYHINALRETGTLQSIVSSYRGQPQECEDYRSVWLDISA